MEEQGLWYFVDKVPTLPTNPQFLVAHNKNHVKARRILLEGVKDHIILHLFEKKSMKEMCTTIVGLYQSNNETMIMKLKFKLRSIKMSKSDSVVTYLTKFTQVRDDLEGVGETTPNFELVRLALMGFTKPRRFLSTGLWLGRSSHIKRDCGVISSKRRSKEGLCQGLMPRLKMKVNFP